MTVNNFGMDRIDKIINNSVYTEHLEAITQCELTRIYCHHDMVHFLDVARIATILAYEDGIEIDRDVIYAAALLHDIGRDVQYGTGMAHESASAVIAEDILKEAGYKKCEADMIIEAIAQHGNEQSALRKDLAGILYRGDKLSRKCFCCDAVSTCHKADYKRNHYIKY